MTRITMSAENTISEIERAFDGIARPETSLRQFNLTDKHGMSGDISASDWARAANLRVDAIWQDIPDVEIKECGNQLAHMQADEFLYYLPAYMRYAVKHVTLSIWESDILGGVVFSLSPKSQITALNLYHLAQLVLINKSQKNSIVNFLNFLATTADEVHRPDAMKAIERYWNHSDAIQHAASLAVLQK